MHRQRTVRQSVACKGIGLHTGRVIEMKIHPAPEDHGIVFLRTDTRRSVKIPARLDLVRDTNLATTLGTDGVTVSTVEHFLSACVGTGVDNALVEINGPELPIMDGSAAPFVYLLRSAGIFPQSKFKRCLVIKRPFRIHEGDKWAWFLPADELKVTFSIQFPHHLINYQWLEFSFSDSSYDREISRARTFGFLKDVERMKSHGFALGGSLDNAVVLDDFRVLNQEGLRYPDEFVRHKVLDALGDLSLLGVPLIGHLVAHKAGHTLNIRLLRGVMSQKGAWKIVEFPCPEEGPRVPCPLPVSRQPEPAVFPA